MEKSYNIFDLPPRLFKYYRYDSALNEKRLSGEVYLASPFDFNDPCDCQREVINNTSDRVNRKGVEWLKIKMKELEYNKEEADTNSRLLLTDDSIVKEVHKRMLERLGILCLTSTQSDTLMWGYYANNDGICIEYDVSKLAKSIAIGFVNRMSYTTTKFLYLDEKYYMIPEQRTPKLNRKCFEKVNAIIKPKDIKNLRNKYLDEQPDTLKKLNFVRNVLLKRMYARNIEYRVEPDGSPSPLFFDRDNKLSETKYFKKTQTWNHENEFRFIVSLGGRLPINIGKECIKNVYLGCNITNERIAAITYLMNKNNLTANLYKMKRLKNCGLAPQSIDWNAYKDNISSFEKHLLEKFPED